MGIAISSRSKIILSMLIWGSIALFVRNIALTSSEIAFFRALIGSIFLILISLISGDRIDKEVLKTNLPTLLISGSLLGINWILLFQAMKYTSIANASLSYYFAPVFIVVFSLVFLKEKISLKNSICLLGAILGLFLILKSSDSKVMGDYNHLKGISYGLAGAVLYASVVMLNKKIKGLSGFQATLIQLSIAALVLAPIVLRGDLARFGQIGIKGWILILILGVVHTGIAYLLYFPSIKDVESGSIAILSYLDPIVAILTSFIFLGESMVISQFIGGILILSTAYISEKNN